MDCGLIISLLLSFCLKETIAVSCRRLEVPLQRVSFVAFFFFLSLSLPSSLELVIYQGFQDFWFLTCCGLDHKTKLIPVDFCSSLLGRSAGNMFFFILFIILFLIMVFNESNTLSFRYTFNKILPSFPGAATAWCSSQHSYWNLAQIDNCFVFVFNSWPCNACINK